MDKDGVLGDKYAVEFILLLSEGTKMESEFKRVCSNYYAIQKTLDRLIEDGYVERVEIKRSRARHYDLTEKGFKVADQLSRTIEVLDSL